MYSVDTLVGLQFCSEGLLLVQSYYLLVQMLLQKPGCVYEKRHLRAYQVL